MFRNKSVKMGHNALYYYEGIFRIDCLQFLFFLPVFWILYFIGFCFRVNRSVCKINE